MHKQVRTQKGTYKLLKPQGVYQSCQFYKAKHLETLLLVFLSRYSGGIMPGQPAIIEKLARFQFKHFLNIIDFSFNDSDNTFILVTELCDDNLYNYLIKQGVNNFPLKERINYFLQIVKGVEEIHKIGLIHSNLNPENFQFLVIMLTNLQNDLVLLLLFFKLRKFIQKKTIQLELKMIFEDTNTNSSNNPKQIV